MISRYSTVTVSVAALVAAAAFASSPLSAVQKRPAQPAAAAATAHSTVSAISGTVKTFAPGRELVVTTSSGPKTYNLGAAHAEISADLAVGDRVNVEQKTGNDGRPVLKISKQTAGR